MYVLQSETTGRRYTGQTDDLDRRLAEHNNATENRRKHTSRQAGPWKLVHKELYETRAQAMSRERWLKSGVGRRWLSEQLVGASPPQAD